MVSALCACSSLIQLVAGERRRCETTDANPAIREVEAEEALRIAKGLRGGDRVSEVLDDIEHLGLFASSDSLESISDIKGSLLGVFSSIGLATQKLSLLI